MSLFTSTGKAQLQPKLQPRFKERKMRLKQAIRATLQMQSVLAELQQTASVPSSVEFCISFNMMQVEKRWKEFTQSFGRIMYTLKRDLATLHKIEFGQSEKNDDRYYRLLASSARTCLNLLLRLQKFPEKIKVKGKGKDILHELTVIVSSFQYIIHSSQVYFNKLKNKQEEQQEQVQNIDNDDDSDNSQDESSLILSSDALETVQPENIRNKLYELATEQSKAKKKKKKRYICRKEKEKMKIIHPLRQNRETMNKRQTTNEEVVEKIPMMEVLPEGRKVEFIHDNLSLKIRPRGIAHPVTYVINKREEQSPEKKPVLVTRTSNDVSLTKKDAKKIASRAAEDVIKKLLTDLGDITSNQIHEDRSSNRKKEVYWLNHNTKHKIEEIIKRCDEVISERRKLSMFLVESQNRYRLYDSQQPSPTMQQTTEQVHNLRDQISKAQSLLQSLEDINGETDVASRPTYDSREYPTRSDSLNRGKKTTAMGMHDKIQQQTERFWMSLHERGYIRNPNMQLNSTLNNTNKISSPLLNIGAREGSKDNNRSIKASRLPKKHQETQVDFSSSSSEEASFVSASKSEILEEDVRQDVRSSRSSSSCEEQVVSNNQYHSASSHSADKNTTDDSGSDIDEDLPTSDNND